MQHKSITKFLSMQTNWYSVLIIISCLCKIRKMILILNTFASDVQDKERRTPVWGKEGDASKGWESIWQS